MRLKSLRGDPPAPAPSAGYKTQKHSHGRGGFNYRPDDREHGPAGWAAKWPLCNGTMQSPVNVDAAGMNSMFAVAERQVGMRETEVEEDPRLKPVMIRYPALAPLRVVNNGHGLLVDYPSRLNGTLAWGDDTYRLRQFHLHTPGEHTFDGVASAMELHLVHELVSGPAKRHVSGIKFLIVAVRFVEGPPSALLASFFHSLPAAPGGGMSKPSVKIINADQPLDLTMALFGKTTKKVAPRGYYTYTGSLSTPPCLEQVTWVLLKQPQMVSGQQVLALREVLRDGANARPVQNKKWPLGTLKIRTGAAPPSSTGLPAWMDMALG